VAERAGLLSLPLTLAQAELAGGFAAAHKDPFDRLLAAQAIDRDLTLLTVDPALEGFGCRIA
jgi:PIN domain nuclease of toxin-antitoxin system